MNPVKYLIKGAILPNGDQRDIAIQDGVITAIAQNLSAASSPGQIVIDAKASRVLPGLVDLHTHLRQPGREDAETVLTGSRAGAKG